MKTVGIIGTPHSGKSTLFTALTRTGSTGGRSNQAVVDVPDGRLDVLSRIERSKRIVPAKVRFVDVPGGLSARGLAEHRQSDALCVVVRCFGADADPARELASVQAELVLADLASVESGLSKAAKKAKGSRDTAPELETLEEVRRTLESEQPLASARLDSETLKLVKGYGLLTLKPWIVVANVEEDDVTTGPARLGLGDDAIVLSAALEAEVASLPREDAAELLEGFGIKEAGLNRVIEACYRGLDLITFLTTGEDESRAWEVPRGARAPEAAGVIHSDLERGFIRAEVVSYDELVASGSWDAAKKSGLLRVEGKDYPVREGDVIHVRFAV
jgi:GTP-binding protein YchF